MHRKLILLLFISFILVACGKSKEVDKSSSTPQTSSSDTQSATDTQAAGNEEMIPQVSGQPKQVTETSPEVTPMGEAVPGVESAPVAPEADAATGMESTAAAPDMGKAAVKTTTAAPGAAADKQAEMLALAKTSGCLACHKLESKIVGPSWKAVAERYNGDPAARDRLITKVSKGGRGNWKEVVGNAAMPPYSPRVSEENIGKLVDFILGLK